MDSRVGARVAEANPLAPYGLDPFNSAFVDAEGAGAIMLLGTDVYEEMPVFWLRIRKGVKNGARLVIANPRATEADRLAYHRLRHRPGTELDLLRGLLAALVESPPAEPAPPAPPEQPASEGEAPEPRARDLSGLRDVLGGATVEGAASACGVTAETLRAAAATLGGASRPLIYVGVGAGHPGRRCRPGGGPGQPGSGPGPAPGGELLRRGGQRPRGGPGRARPRRGGPPGGGDHRPRGGGGDQGPLPGGGEHPDHPPGRPAGPGGPGAGGGGGGAGAVPHRDGRAGGRRLRGHQPGGEGRHPDQRRGAPADGALRPAHGIAGPAGLAHPERPLRGDGGRPGVRRRGGGHARPAGRRPRLRLPGRGSHPGRGGPGAGARRRGSGSGGDRPSWPSPRRRCSSGRLSRRAWPPRGA